MNEKKYCAAPWKSLHISPQSDIRVCCYGKSNFGNLMTDNIADVLQGKEIKVLRDTIQQGKLHEEYCAGCIATEKVAGESERSWHNNIAGNFDCTTVDNNYYAPSLLDLRWNITCNMSCSYCNSYASSKWAKLNGEKDLPTPSGKFLQPVLDFIESVKDSINTVALIGGEPLLLPPNDPLLDILPETIKILVMTNLNADIETNNIFKKLINRKNVIWTVSFENIGKQFEYVRYGGKWDKQVKNIRLLQEHNADLSLMSVYSVYNATRLNEFLDWTTSNNLMSNWQILTYPQELAVSNQQKIVELAINELKVAICRVDIDDKEREFFKEMLNTLTTPDIQDMSKKLIKYNIEMEEFHPDMKGKFNEFWPEIAEKINE